MTKLILPAIFNSSMPCVVMTKILGSWSWTHLHDQVINTGTWILSMTVAGGGVMPGSS